MSKRRSAAERRKNLSTLRGSSMHPTAIHGLPGVLPNSRMVRERPPRSLRSRLPLTRERLRVNLPLVRGRAAKGGRGSLTHHLELKVSTRGRRG